MEDTKYAAKNAITRFDKSPHYIKYGEMRDYQVKLGYELSIVDILIVKIMLYNEDIHIVYKHSVINILI